MFKPSHYIRICFLMITLATLAGCADEGSLLGPEASSSLALGVGNGGNGGRGGGGGNGGGGGGGSDAPVVEDFDFWDPSAWVPGDHPLGRGFFEPENVSHKGNKLLVLTLPAGTHNGGEIRSASRVQFRDVEVRLRTPRASGSISAFFLYEFVLRRNGEIDIEILNDGSREILFTTWVGGQQTNHVRHTLSFDPAVGFHDYRIEWSRRLDLAQDLSGGHVRGH